MSDPAPVRFERLRRTGVVTGRWTRRLIWVAVWVVVSLSVTAALFLASSRSTTIASHEAVLRPSLDGRAQLSSGPVLPDLRIPSGFPVGVRIELGKTDARSTDDLVQRYALLASNPDGQIDKIRGLLLDMAAQAALRGAAIGFVPVALWALIGATRRRELLRSLRSWRGVAGGTALLMIGVAVWQPWAADEPRTEAVGTWQPLPDFLGPAVPIPAALDKVQILVDPTTNESKRLVESAISTYDKSKAFYTKAAEDAATLDLRRPEPGETVALLVSDRHDNIGMDQVARAIAERGDATVVLDAGDDTSTGSDMEAFSLDSLNKEFEDFERWAVTGNHDNGTFVHRYLADLGWQMLDGEVVAGPGGVTMLGVDDPRSSGLGDWRDESGLSFAEVGERLADAACAADRPVSLVLVHDANLAKEALARGCVELAVGGHLHVQVGPTAVRGTRADGTEHLGFSYTNGTTGGAAYAIAVGSKPRRDAQVSLITIRDGHPVGIQPVTLRTDGRYLVGEWISLDSSLIGVVVPGSVPSEEATPPVEESPKPRGG